jgi:hypothetical protein
MKTKQAKDFLVQQAAEQAARENIPLSEIEKKMMYFTESDATSCDNPVELNDEFEAQYDTAEYEAKISRLLHNAYKRLKVEDPERARDWDQSTRILRTGDHYLLVLLDLRAPNEHLGDLKPPTGHPVRDSLKLLGLGVLVAMGVVVAALLAAEYNLNLDRFRKHLPAPSPRLAIVIYLGLLLLALGGFRLFNRVLGAWFRRRTKKDKESG